VTRRRFLVLTVLLFLFAAGLRLFGWNYDQGHHFHPDERRIAEAVTTITFSPLQLNPKFFAYGSFPFYVTRLAQAGLERIDARYAGYDGAIRTGRQLSAIWGASTVVLLVVLGSLLYGRRVALLGGLFLSLAVLHLQNSHFGTNDVPLTFLSLLCLTALVPASRSGEKKWFVLAGVALGLAVATKFSALPLGAAVVAALALRARKDGWGGTIRNAALLGTVAAVAFAVGSPYAILDFRAYSNDILEQSRMVRNAGSVPYTNQYVGTPKGWYELREILFWGLGPFLGIAALFGAGLRIRRALAPRRRSDLVLLAWAVPFFLVTASFDVKFPRYLLPLYPLLCLWAAAALASWSVRAAAGRILTKAVSLGVLAYAVAFLTIYSRPFALRQAAEWVYENVPAGSKILSQDWDEGFPFPLAERGNPDRFRVVNFPFYDADSPEKMTRLAGELSSSDFVALQTKRLYGATTRNAKAFPLTSRAFSLLFNGELGYRLVQEFASRPKLFGIELPSELADESFSVYDHPKALIFENTRRLPVREIASVLLDETVTPPLTRTQLLLARPQDEQGTRVASPVKSSLVAVLLAYAFLQLLGFSTFALLRTVIPDFKGLYALGKVLGVLAFASAAWLGSSLGAFEFRAGPLLLVAAVLVTAGLRAHRRNPGPSFLKEAGVTELVTGGAFFLFLFFRTLNPEIFWGEKPMDFSFLNTLYRAVTLPPPESWCSGTSLSYTYFGHFLVAAIGKALGIAPPIMFNIGIAVAGWLLSAALFFAGSVAGRSLSSGVAATVLGLFTGTLAGPVELIARRGVMDFHYFWATSRIIPPNGISEYPFWSLLFADLHAHLFAMPWAVTLIGVVLLWLRRLDTPSDFRAKERTALLAANSVLFGALALSSGWSVPTYALLPAFAVLFDLPGLLRREGTGAGAFSNLGARGLMVAVPPVAGFLLFLPFWWRFTAPPRQIGWEVGPFAPPLAVLQVFGLFLALLVPFLYLGLRESRSPWRGYAVLALFPLLLLDPRALLHGRLAQAPSVLPLFLGLALLGLTLCVRPDPFRRRIAMLATYAFTIIAGCEVVFVWDRMNTIFKFHLDAWLILSVAAAPVAAALVRGWMPGARGPVRWQRWIAAAAALPAFFTVISGPFSSAWPRKTPGPDGTLDGTAYLGVCNREESAVFEWLNSTVSGLPTLAEAFGPSYQDFSRGAMFTGLPIVIGWDYHVSQRGRPWRDIERRKADVARLYRSEDREEIARILKHYRIRYVLSASKETETYGSGHRSRFVSWPELFRTARQWGDAFLYETDFTGASPRRSGDPAQAVAEILRLGQLGAVPLPASVPLKEPRGVVLDADGNAYVSDFGNNRIVKLDRKLEPVASWGARGKEAGFFDQPSAITLLPDGNIAVLDTWNSRIQVLTPKGEFVRQIRGDLYGPRGMAFRKDGSALLADTGNSRLVLFDKDGVVIDTWGGLGSAPRQFMGPVGIAIGPDGNVYVCDPGNGRLQILSPTGEFVRQIPLPGLRAEALSEPRITFGPAGQAVVILPVTREVLKLRKDGTVERLASLPSAPMDACFSADGRRLLVVDVEGRLTWIDAESGIPAS
jgi:YYY domain-containing protein